MQRPAARKLPALAKKLGEAWRWAYLLSYDCAHGVRTGGDVVAEEVILISAVTEMEAVLDAPARGALLLRRHAMQLCWGHHCALLEASAASYLWQNMFVPAKRYS